MNRYWRYLWPVGLTAAALGCRMLLDPILGSGIPYATFYVAAAVAALVGGLVPGLITTLLGAVAACYFVLQPRHSFVIESPEEQLGLALDLIVSVTLVAFVELQRRARLRAQRSEETERVERQRFEVTLASIGDGVIATDREARVTFLNEVAARLTGCPAGEALGQPIESVFVIRNEDTGAPVENPVQKAIREGKIVGLANHTVLISRDGTRRPIDDSGAPIFGPGGRVIGGVLVFRDVSDMRRREAEIRTRDRMVELSHDAIIVMDRDRRVTGWNRGARELYGFDESEARGRDLGELLQTRGASTIAEADAALRRDGHWDGELTHICKDGREIIVESRHVLLRDLGDEAAGILEINRDITERKRVEEELRRAVAEAEEGRRTLEAVMENLPEALIIAEAPDGRIRLVSREGAAMAGRPREQLEGLSAEEHLKAWGFRRENGAPPRVEELPLQRAVRRGETSTDEEWTLERPDGRTLVVLGKAAPVRDARQGITGGLVVWRDITERKRLEEKLLEAAKLESLGVLAGGIAHDFNNLLTGVLGNASLLAEALPEGSTFWKYARNIANAAEEAAKLSQQMLAYSGRGRFVIEPVQLSTYIRRIAPLLESSIPKYVELVMDLAAELPPIEADVSQLQQVLMNLMVNGAEAIGPEGGRVTVATRPICVRERQIRGTLTDEFLAPGTYVELEVADTGCGMDREMLGRIFDPFFTTKFLGRGLGLAAVQGIVRGHKGSIHVASAPGRGTTFRVLFPAAATTAPAMAPADAEARQPASGSGTVLVIDDEEVIRSTATNALRRLGYTVATAASGAEGIGIFHKMRDRIAAVVLDLTMPGLSGQETLEELRRIDPQVPVVLSSGFSETEAMAQFGRYRLEGFLQKPYSLKTLAERVRAAARARRAGRG